MCELRSVLYVEDDADIRAVVTLALQAVGGLDIYTCGSGHEAVTHASERRPDLILLDVMMPVMDGRQTLRALRRQPTTADIPVVFVTACLQRDDCAEYLALGAVDVIAKPFDPVELPRRLRQIWARVRDG